MEQWNLYDKDGNLLDKLHHRGALLENGFYHMVVSNWIKNDDGLYLIQKRNKPLKYINPWSVTAGSAIAGETNIEAVHRETLEEMGLDFIQEDFRFIERTFFDVFFMDVFETTWNGKASEINFDPNEVTDVKWVTTSELQQMFLSKDFYCHETEYLRRILDYSIV